MTKRLISANRNCNLLSINSVSRSIDDKDQNFIPKSTTENSAEQEKIFKRQRRKEKSELSIPFSAELKNQGGKRDGVACLNEAQPRFKGGPCTLDK